MEREAVTKYAKSAKAHGEATSTGDHRRANVAYDEIMDCLRAIKLEGRESELLDLLADQDASVRLWAATHTLQVDEKKAVATLRDIAAAGGVSAFSAEMVLDQWSKGELVIPA